MSLHPHVLFMNDILPISNLPEPDFNKADSEANFQTTESFPVIPTLPDQGTTPQIEEFIVKMPGGPDAVVIEPDTKPARKLLPSLRI